MLFDNFLFAFVMANAQCSSVAQHIKKSDDILLRFGRVTVNELGWRWICFTDIGRVDRRTDRYSMINVKMVIDRHES